MGNDAIFILLLCAVLFVALPFLPRPHRQRGHFRDGRPRYRPHATLLSPTELEFYRALVRATTGNYLISMKVRVADVVTPEAHADRAAWWAAFSKVSSKHIDFVLVDAETAAIRLAIEIDDRSHGRRDRRDRDAFVDQVFVEAGVPLLRIRARGRGGYDPQNIRQGIAEALAVSS